MRFFWIALIAFSLLAACRLCIEGTPFLNIVSDELQRSPRAMRNCSLRQEYQLMSLAFKNIIEENEEEFQLIDTLYAPSEAISSETSALLGAMLSHAFEIRYPIGILHPSVYKKLKQGVNGSDCYSKIRASYKRHARIPDLELMKYVFQSRQGKLNICHEQYLRAMDPSLVPIAYFLVYGSFTMPRKHEEDEDVGLDCSSYANLTSSIKLLYFKKVRTFMIDSVQRTKRGYKYPFDQIMEKNDYSAIASLICFLKLQHLPKENRNDIYSLYLDVLFNSENFCRSLDPAIARELYPLVSLRSFLTDKIKLSTGDIVRPHTLIEPFYSLDKGNKKLMGKLTATRIPFMFTNEKDFNLAVPERPYLLSRFLETMSALDLRRFNHNIRIYSNGVLYFGRAAFNQLTFTLFNSGIGTIFEVEGDTVSIREGFPSEVYVGLGRLLALYVLHDQVINTPFMFTEETLKSLVFESNNHLFHVKLGFNQVIRLQLPLRLIGLKDMKFLLYGQRNKCKAYPTLLQSPYAEYMFRSVIDANSGNKVTNYPLEFSVLEDRNFASDLQFFTVDNRLLILIPRIFNPIVIKKQLERSSYMEPLLAASRFQAVSDVTHVVEYDRLDLLYDAVNREEISNLIVTVCPYHAPWPEMTWIQRMVGTHFSDLVALKRIVRTGKFKVQNKIKALLRGDKDSIEKYTKLGKVLALALKDNVITANYLADAFIDYALGFHRRNVRISDVMNLSAFKIDEMFLYELIDKTSFELTEGDYPVLLVDDQSKVCKVKADKRLEAVLAGMKTIFTSYGLERVLGGLNVTKDDQLLEMAKMINNNYYSDQVDLHVLTRYLKAINVQPGMQITRKKKMNAIMRTVVSNSKTSPSTLYINTGLHLPGVMKFFNIIKRLDVEYYFEKPLFFDSSIVFTSLVSSFSYCGLKLVNGIDYERWITYHDAAEVSKNQQLMPRYMPAMSDMYYQPFSLPNGRVELGNPFVSSILLSLIHEQSSVMVPLYLFRLMLDERLSRMDFNEISPALTNWVLNPRLRIDPKDGKVSSGHPREVAQKYIMYREMEILEVGESLSSIIPVDLLATITPEDLQKRCYKVLMSEEDILSRMRSAISCNFTHCDSAYSLFIQRYLSYVLKFVNLGVTFISNEQFYRHVTSPLVRLELDTRITNEAKIFGMLVNQLLGNQTGPIDVYTFENLQFYMNMLKARLNSVQEPVIVAEERDWSVVDKFCAYGKLNGNLGAQYLGRLTSALKNVELADPLENMKCFTRFLLVCLVNNHSPGVNLPESFYRFLFENKNVTIGTFSPLNVPLNGSFYKIEQQYLLEDSWGIWKQEISKWYSLEVFSNFDDFSSLMGFFNSTAQ